MTKRITGLLLGLLLLALLHGVTAKSQYNITHTERGLNGVILYLDYVGQTPYYVNETNSMIKRVKFEIHCHSYQDFVIRITDRDKARFEVPEEGVFPTDPLKNFSFPINLAGFTFTYSNNPTFDFRVTRKISGETLIDTYSGDFIFSDHYLQIVTEISTEYIYGLGERFNEGFRLRDGKWTIFNRDRGQVIDKGTGLQTYGFYPFYMTRDYENFWHINYFRNSNAMDIIKEQKDNKRTLTYKVIGGIFDFRFILGEQLPMTLIDKFHLFLGRSAVPPFWSLGFHQCRWGYKNVSMLEEVIAKYEANDLPLDNIWSDIDYMVEYEDFTIDESRFPLDRMKAITDKYQYIPIIDAGIKINDGIAYNEGKARGVFVKDGNGNELQGWVWPGNTTFVDFFHPNATQYWGYMLNILYEKVKFSGIWLDMNEYANFCDGPCSPPVGEKKFDYSKDLPYAPGSDSIEAHTIPLNSTHYGNRLEADVHAFAALLETYATSEFLKSKNLRPFIITRSSTLGSNRFGFHWTGDNYASFEFLKGSIADNFLNQLWGFQMVGPDICGFGGNTNEELCSRWYQLATLYPFARSHNDQRSISQEPYALGQTVLTAAKTNLKLRYSLLKHYYSVFVARRGMGSIYNPLLLVFPGDKENYRDEVADTQFLVGYSLMAAPILEQGQTSRNVHFTSENWHDIYTGKMYPPGSATIDNVKLTDKLPLFLRQGAAIFMQNTDKVRSTRDLDNKYHLVAAMRYNKNKSDQDHKYYDSEGSHLSIQDYNDEKKLSQCLSTGCDYTFTFSLADTGNTRSLNIKASYAGGLLLNELFIINEVTILYEGVKVHVSLQNPVEVRGLIDVTIPINDQLEHHHLIRQE